ncbi:hypothetical protein [Herbiconiux daphne]|uniref:Uncharacterized protein n=1 Tax=Herbiconiux daphne TaxID=2970914 RepID=A0ABT2H1C8_9MICO|nr:hypothetical protein [Herbiconiux daphne]MCS5733721.1 hypothetical protein [Herbiconiux daphne]
MSQTDVHEFEIREKPGGVLRATIARQPDGSWTTHPEDSPAGDRPPAFDDRPTPQAAFNAFIEWANGGPAADE